MQFVHNEKPGLPGYRLEKGRDAIGAPRRPQPGTMHNLLECVLCLRVPLSSKFPLRAGREPPCWVGQPMKPPVNLISQHCVRHLTGYSVLHITGIEYQEHLLKNQYMARRIAAVLSRAKPLVEELSLAERSVTV